jgi:hypothetical protein
VERQRHQVGVRLHPVPVDVDHLRVRVDPDAQLAHDDAVDRHAAREDQLLRRAT